ncbi:MAG: glycosyltransferase family 4 protein [Candidatus Omnitrophica bacterium]|nr:glycosyltransferase family 4 protein [Candidatus Omnitrophota bacterium]
MKKIAFVSTNEWASWGGSEELWAQTAIRMGKQGFLVGVNIKGWEETPSRIQEMERSGCMVKRRWYKRRNIFHRAASKVFRSMSMYGWLDKFAPGLVVISQGNNFDGINWMQACVTRDIPYVVISHTAAANFWPVDERAFKAAELYQRAKRCFFVSKAILKLTEKQLATSLDNAKIVRNPHNVPYCITLPWPKEEGVYRLACVGSLEPVSKGQDILFEVLCSDKWRRRPLEVTLFGAGYNEKSLKRLKDLWCLDKVRFAGFEDDVESIWKNNHGLILPSRYEGLPMAIIEAMLCGRICIVTDVGGNTELLEDNVNGFVVKAPQVEFLDEAMERAWNRKDSWPEIGQLAAVSVRKIIPSDSVGVFIDELKLLI